MRPAAGFLTSAALLACLASAPAAAAAGDPPAQDAAAPAPPAFRLPAGVRPTGYEVELTLDPAAETFQGRIQIAVEAAAATSLVWLNATGLEIESVEVTAGGQTVPARTVDGGKDFVGLALESPVGPGAATLRIAYAGKVATKEWEGVFRQEENGVAYLYTQFEAFDARRAFPCFDEPSYKVPWQLTLIVPRGLLAVANMPVASSSVTSGGRSRLVFDRTPPLPSYLVAFAVGPFDVVDAGRAGRRRTPVRILATRGRASEARYAAEATPPLLALHEEYFDSPYPYPKLDLVALPRFLGAMENPGLVTFASRLLLATPERETPRHRRVFASICAHELAHMWFGDLVTLAWWDDAWLNEAFATWMGEKMVDRYRPEWQGKVEMAADRVAAMSGDTLVSARAVRQPIETPDDIVAAFDGITYRKGAAVLEMFEGWLGEEIFRKGVGAYLKTHAHASADAEAFMAALSEAAGRDVAAAFATFLDQPGIPVVDIARRCDGAAPALEVTQERYLPVGAVPPEGADPSWQIPLCMVLDDRASTRRCELVTGTRTVLPLGSKTPCPGRVDANPGARGYYIVRRTPDDVAALLADPRLPAHERTGVLSEVALLARGGHFPLGKALAIAGSLADDPSLHVAQAAANIARSPWPRLVGEDQTQAYRSFVLEAFGPRARRLGLTAGEGEPEEDAILRPTLIALVLLDAEDPALQAEAEALARRWLAEREGVDDDMVDLVLEALVHTGDAALFATIEKQALAARDDREQRRLLAALVKFRDPKLVAQALDLLLSDEVEAFKLSRMVWAAREEERSAAVLLGFVRAHYDELVSRMPRNWAAGLPDIGRAFCDPERREEIAELFEERAPQHLGGARNLMETLEAMDLCIAWKEAQASSVREFLAAR